MNHESIESVGASRGSYKSYAAGFILAIVLTIISFWLAMSGAAPRWGVLLGIFAAAIAQLLVHLHYFLHLDTSSAARWNLMALLITALIMGLFVGGSIWIMYSLYHRMM